MISVNSHICHLSSHAGTSLLTPVGRSRAIVSTRYTLSSNLPQQFYSIHSFQNFCQMYFIRSEQLEDSLYYIFPVVCRVQLRVCMCNHMFIYSCTCWVILYCEQITPLYMHTYTHIVFWRLVHRLQLHACAWTPYGCMVYVISDGKLTQFLHMQLVGTFSGRCTLHTQSIQYRTLLGCTQTCTMHAYLVITRVSQDPHILNMKAITVTYHLHSAVWRGVSSFWGARTGVRT